MLKPIALASVLMLLFQAPVLASTDFSSPDFTDAAPIITIQGGRSASADFQLISDVGQVVIGESTSSNFTYRSGFLYFPFVNSPVITATAGDGQVALGWTPAATGLGITITGYEVGTSASTGGPYTYSAVGNVLSSARIGLTNNTRYYFVVRALDFYGNSAATSSEATALPIPGAQPPAGGGGGGAGGALVAPPQTTITFSGMAYPLSTITLLKDAQIILKSVAGPDAKFNLTYGNLSAGSYIFSLYGQDDKGNRSTLQTFPITLTDGASTYVSGIFVAPTINVDKDVVKKGDNIGIFGQTAPAANVVISVHSGQEYFVNAGADKSGAYFYNFDTSPLNLGEHETKSKSALNGQISSYGNTIAFNVGNENIIPKKPGCPLKADLNDDCKVNLVDYSIAAYWYKRSLSAPFAAIEKAKLNGDGKINLVDFSIMAYYWTG